MSEAHKISDIVEAYENCAWGVLLELEKFQDYKIKCLVGDISQLLQHILKIVPEIKDEYYLEKEQKEKLLDYFKSCYGDKRITLAQAEQLSRYIFAIGTGALIWRQLDDLKCQPGIQNYIRGFIEKNSWLLISSPALLKRVSNAIDAIVEGEIGKMLNIFEEIHQVTAIFFAFQLQKAAGEKPWSTTGSREL